MATIAGYRLGSLLGQGAYGETYEATKDGQRVKLKPIREEAAQQGFDLRRFQREVRYFVVMEHLEGRDLAHAFQAARKKFDEPDLQRILAQIVAGLQVIHDQNIVHRGLKPGNVSLTSIGEVKMLDYTTLKTMPGQAIGTPLYIAPETFRGDSVDYRADFYSLGVLICNLVTGGQLPFTRPRRHDAGGLRRQRVCGPPGTAGMTACG
ncbi:MAG: serine/threonine protein kinase [Anaerolineae bacterium]|nr:serine/threonine protein kinase [Anaerolineae bacterium]